MLLAKSRRKPRSKTRKSAHVGHVVNIEIKKTTITSSTGSTCEKRCVELGLAESGWRSADSQTFFNPPTHPRTNALTIFLSLDTLNFFYILVY